MSVERWSCSSTEVVSAAWTDGVESLGVAEQTLAAEGCDVALSREAGPLNCTEGTAP